MTQPPTPPYGAYPSQPGPFPPPPYPPAGPQRRRPSGWWFVLGGAMLVAAVVTFVGLFAWTLTGFMDVDSRVVADGTAQRVQVGTDGERMVWVDDDLPGAARLADDCVVADAATGRELRGRGPGGTYTRSGSSGSWVAVARYSPGSGTWDVTCPAALGEVEVGPAPAVAGFVGGILATILVPLVLGGLGVVVLIVTGVLWATGRPRHAPA